MSEVVIKQEIHPKSETRAGHRERLLESVNPNVKPFIQQITTSHSLKPYGANENLQNFANTLKGETHAVLFDLASSSSSAEELRAIFRTISGLRDVHWDSMSSEMNFSARLGKFNPTDVSPEAKKLKEKFIKSGQNIEDFFDTSKIANDYTKPRYILETFFYILASEDINISTKRLMLSMIGSKNLAFEKMQRIFLQDVSFWKHVDSSWTNPDLQFAVETIKNNPNIDIKDVDQKLLSENARLLKELQQARTDKKRLEKTVTEKDAEIKRLEGELAIANALNDVLGVDEKPEKTSINETKPTLNEAYKILGIKGKRDDKLAGKVFTRLAMLFHSDRHGIVLQGQPQEIVDAARVALNQIFVNLNNAKDAINNSIPGPVETKRS